MRDKPTGTAISASDDVRRQNDGQPTFVVDSSQRTSRVRLLGLRWVMKRPSSITVFAALCLLASQAGFAAEHPQTSSQSSDRGSTSTPPSAPRSNPPRTRGEQPRRVVAIGDVHGDLRATRLALHLAGAIDSNDRWIGKDLVVVQLGDQIDRGEDDRAVLDLFERIADEAHAAGGALYALIGNHEALNVALDFRYVASGAYTSFSEFANELRVTRRSRRLRVAERGRGAAFQPGGSYARLLGKRNVVVMIGGTVFVHGGITPRYARYGLERINREAREWMLGKTPGPPHWIEYADSPLWTRSYSVDVEARDCELLRRTLRILGAKRMVVAHTVQDKGVTSACNEMVWRIDVGMAKHYGGTVEIVELVGEEMRVIKTQ